MLKEAIYHSRGSGSIYARDRRHLVFKIRAAREDLSTCELILFRRETPDEKQTIRMETTFRDALFDYYEAHVALDTTARYLKYYFHLVDRKGRQCYVSERNISSQVPTDFFYEYLYVNETDTFGLPEWAKGCVYYQIFPERFANGDTSNDPPDTMKWGTSPNRENYMGGDLRGIIKRLDYLSDLGIEAVYLNPIFEGDFNHKYATTDYLEIDEQFGTKADFLELVEQAHKRNIRIVLDGVFNHCGVHFPPFADVLIKGEKSSYKDWFYIRKYQDTPEDNNYECVGDYKWMPKLNTANSEVQEYVLKVMRYWIKEFQIDGWRLDVADEVDCSLWENVRWKLKQQYPSLLLLGETWGVGNRLLEENRLDSIMNYLFRDAVIGYFAKETFKEKQFDHLLNQMLAQYHSETDQVLYNPLDSHDTERFLTLCNKDIRCMKQAVAFQMLFTGAPAIFYGDEIGIYGENDPDCRKCMVWDTKEQNQELLEWYRYFITLRRQEETLRTGNYRTVICDEEKEVFGFVRVSKEDTITAVFSKTKEIDVQIPLLTDHSAIALIDCRKGGTEHEIFTACDEAGRKKLYNSDLMEYAGVANIHMLPYSVQIIKQKRR